MNLLQGEPAGGVVWTADVTYWMAGEKAAGRGDPAWDTETGYLELHRRLGIMPYYYYPKFWTAEARYTNDIRRSSESKGNDTICRIETPLGVLTEVNTYLPTSVSTGCTKHYVQSEQDLDILLYLLEHRRLEPANLADFRDRMHAWMEYDGYPSIGMPRSPLASFVYEWAGIEQATYLLLDHPDRVGRILELLEKQEQPIIDAVCAVAPPLIHFPDNLTSDNFAGLYDAYMGPAHVRRLDRLHSAGIKVVVHLDGTIRGLLPKLVESGFDGIEALTPAPVGDVDVDEIQDLADSESVILWGGVPGAMFSPPYTWADMQRHIEQVLECWNGRPFVLGVADQVPPDGDISFCRRIADMLSRDSVATPP